MKNRSLGCFLGAIAALCVPRLGFAQAIGNPNDNPVMQEVQAYLNVVADGQDILDQLWFCLPALRGDGTFGPPLAAEDPKAIFSSASLIELSGVIDTSSNPARNPVVQVMPPGPFDHINSIMVSWYDFDANGNPILYARVTIIWGDSTTIVKSTYYRNGGDPWLYSVIVYNQAGNNWTFNYNETVTLLGISSSVEGTFTIP
jgi:hypothetical protein